MLNLPKSTEFNKRIPKQKFYDNIEMSPALKRCFVEQIKLIYWRSKIAPSTVNLAPGKQVEEIEIFEIRLQSRSLDEAVLRQIDKEIPYHLIFLLELEGLYQVWTAYKESSASSKNAFKVGVYYHTDWMKESELPLKLDGLDMDAVYENFVRQIGGKALAASGKETLRQSVERDARRQELQKQIDALQVKVRREKQLNKQVQLNAELKKLKIELGELS